MMDRKLLLFAGLVLSWSNLLAQSPVTARLEPFATGLTRVTDIAHAGDERLFAVLRSGTVRIVMPDGTVLPTPFLDITSRVRSSGNEQGLLGLAFDPGYASNGRFYVNYTTGPTLGTTRVSRFTVTTDPNVANPNSEEVLFTLAQPYNNHNGGDLEFGPDGNLYISLGDGGGAGDPEDRAQDLTSAFGTILRIDVRGGTSYAIPPDNPFTHHGDTLPEIWASGLRNPWRIGFDALTGDLWIGDVGQTSREEVDFWPAGNNTGPNFGWRCYQGDITYNTAGCRAASAYVPPVRAHSRSGLTWCAVIGGRVYRGRVFHRLYGRYLYTDHCHGRIYSLRPNGSGGWTGEQLSITGRTGISCIGENSALELFAGDVRSDTLYRIVDACGADRPTITQTGSTLTCTPALAYAWYRNGTRIPDTDQRTYEAVQPGTYTVLATLGPDCEIMSASVFVTSLGLPDQVGPGISVRPVPADDRLVLEGLPEGVLTIQLIDLAGRTALSLAERAREGQVLLDVAGQAPGGHVLTVRGEDGAVLLRRVVTIQR